MFNNLELLALILTLATYTCAELGMIGGSLCMLMRGLWRHNPREIWEGCAGVVVGICVILGTYSVVISLLNYWLST